MQSYWGQWGKYEETPNDIYVNFLGSVNSVEGENACEGNDMQE